MCYRIIYEEDKLLKHPDIHLRLYRAILAAGAAFSVISIVGNYISAFPLAISAKWIFLFFITVLAFVFSYNEKYTYNIMFGVFIFAVCIFLPFAFIDSGGSNNNALGYTFFLLIAITYLFKGLRRTFLVVSLVCIFVIMHVLEYYYPNIIAVYHPHTQFVDRIIQVPILLLISYFIILRFAKEYEKVNKRLEAFANLDELTGLYNRRMFNITMEETVKNNKNTAVLAFMDLDNFKLINDNFGHHVGDEVLKELSSLLQKTFGNDRHIVSRWGGDEFAVIYYGDKIELSDKIEKISSLFKEYVSSYEETAGISTSIVSIGDYDKISQALSDADNALYKKKLKKQQNRTKLS